MALEETATGAHESAIHVVLKAEELGTFVGIPITNSLLLTWITMAILIVFAVLFSRSLRTIPSKLQAVIEWAVESVLAYMKETLGSEKLARQFFPLIATIFLFVFVANELAFIPGVGSVLFNHVPFLRAPSADLNFTLALAFISFFTIEITGIATLGALKYVKKFVNFNSPVDFAVGIIELVSNLGRLVSFSFRLFGNIFAGEIMILVAIYFLPYVLPVPLMAFEVFVGMIQAVVFSMLTLFFIKLAIMDPHESH